jgi:UDP-N-acetylmuramate dehydrogenase
MNETLRGRLDGIFCGEVLFNCSLARYTSYAIGGPADALIVVHKREKIARLLAFLESESLSWRIIGKGSNLLVSDSGYRGVVIVLGKELSQVSEEKTSGNGTVTLCVGAGCSLTKLNHYCCRHGIGGMEFSYGIPGTLGGAVLMNAGAWGKEMAGVVSEVGVITQRGYHKLSENGLKFAYRKFPGFSPYVGKGVIVDVTLTLNHDDPQLLKKKIKELLEKRKSIQPHNFPNGGSVFKNPQNDSAGRLIDLCGLKGRSVGGAMVSEKHANFIINKDKATAADVLSLMKTVQCEVKNRFGVELDPEIHVM